MKTRPRRSRILAALLATAAIALPLLADDKDLLKQGSSNPNVIIIVSNTYSMQYLPYNQGSPPNLPPDGQYQDSPISKFGLAKGAIRSVVQRYSSQINFGLSWYSYHQESVAHKFWSYRFTSNDTTAGAAYDFPDEAFQVAVGTYEEWGTSGGGPILSTTGTTETFGITGTTLLGPWFGDVPAGATCAANSCVGYAFEIIDKSHRVAVHLTPVGGGQPYGQPTVTVIKDYQTGSPAGNPTTWTTQPQTPAGKPGSVKLTYTAAVSTTDAYPNVFTTGPDANLYMGFMKAGDWNLNSDCGGWFVQNSLPAVGIPRDYQNDLGCSITACTQPPEISTGCVLRYTRPMSAVIHYAAGATGTYTGSSPPDDNPTLCSPSVVHTGAGPEDQVVLMSSNDTHIPEDKMFANADKYFNASDCFVNGVRTDDPNKSCRNGAIILLSDTFQACGPNCSQNATSKYLVNLKLHHVPVYVISLGVPGNTPQAAEAHCIARTSGAETDTDHPGVFSITSTDPAQVASDLQKAFDSILTQVDEATQDFASATISSVQAGNGQMAFLATFNASKSRSIWNGALRGYRLLSNGAINPAPVPPDTHAQNDDLTDCVSTVKDPNNLDVSNNVILDAPCNRFPTLQWNAQMNLAAVPVVPIATDPSGVQDLAAGVPLTRGIPPLLGPTYQDTSNDAVPGLGHDIPIYNYPGRRILWSLPSTVFGTLPTLPATLPINGTSAAAAEPVPEISVPFLVPRSPYWTDPYWPMLKLLMTPQTSPPDAGVPTGCIPPAAPPCPSDVSTQQAVRFIRGDRASVIHELLTAQSSPQYDDKTPHEDPRYYVLPSGPDGARSLKLGDIFHSNPQLVSEPQNVFYYSTNLHNYQDFFNKHQHRRRVFYAGANDGLLHAFDVGVWDRNTSDDKAKGKDPARPVSVCTGGQSHCYDNGTGAELFAYAPRVIMQIFRPLTSVPGIQNERNEWTVDGAPSAADMHIDVNHNGAPKSSNRAWHSVLVGMVREGSALEGQTPCPPPATTTAFQNSASSVYALDITQPEPSDGAGNETPGSYSSPGCLDGGANCPSAWPKVLWEIQDASDADSNGYPDMGESWSKPGLGRICVAKDDSGNCTDERYVALFGGGFDRERKNRRGNWFYIVDVETGFVLYKVKSGVANFGSGNVPANFASIPSEPSAIDLNNDGLLDFAYFGDLLGQMWRLDLRDIKISSTAPTNRWSSKLQNGNGTALSPMLLFQAPQPVGGSTQYFPVYYRPSVVYLGLTSTGQPMLGTAFGTGDRDDVTATCDLSTRSTSYNQRFYFVIDKANTQTVTESTSGMLRIASSSAAPVTTNPTAGWYMLLGAANATLGERVITDSLAIDKYIYVFTQSPAAGSIPGACPPPSTCKVAGGLVRKYVMYYANGNALPTASDRAVTVPNSIFATNPIFYVSGDQSGNVAFTTNHGIFTPSKTLEPTRTNLKDWKEN
jgi:Tfp pilus tip-associated adhesin PilY1